VRCLIARLTLQRVAPPLSAAQAPRTVLPPCAHLDTQLDGGAEFIVAAARFRATIQRPWARGDGLLVFFTDPDQPTHGEY